MKWRANYDIQLGSDRVTPNGMVPLQALMFHSHVNAGAEELMLRLGTQANLSARRGDAVTLSLGWEDNITTVFTGVLESIRAVVGGLDVLCLGNSIQLARVATARTFENQKAGDIVHSLASDVGLAVDKADSGVSLPVYLADSSHSYLRHCLILGEKSGADLYMTAEGKLVFASFRSASPDHTFTYGIDILDARFNRSALLDGVSVSPESPASDSGEETASWLIKDSAPHIGEAGQSGWGVTLADPLLKTKESAESAANSLLARHNRLATGGIVSVMGLADVHIAQTVAVEEFPQADSNGEYQVMGFRHRLDKIRGWNTTIQLGGVV